MSEDDWPAEWTKGVLVASILSVVSQQGAHGYAVARVLTEAGIGSVKGATLYPLLNRLEQDGLLSSSWQEGLGGPGRKCYAITTAGRTELDRLRSAWVSFARTAARVIAAPADGGPDAAPARTETKVGHD
ncbi:MAG TPA: PadR family transcriptional regulator [Propionibacteriaceae bacterium]